MMVRFTRHGAKNGYEGASGNQFKVTPILDDRAQRRSASGMVKIIARDGIILDKPEYVPYRPTEAINIGEKIF